MRLRLLITLLVLTMALLLPLTVYAAAGDLDPTFGDGGIAISSITSEGFTIYDSVVQPDGKILLVGPISLDDPLPYPNGDTFLIRLLVDGSPDPSFGNQGIVMTDIGILLGRDPQSIDGAHDWAIAVALMKDGRFVVTVIEGNNDGFPTSDNLIVARYLADGTLDTDFSDDGGVISNMEALIGGSQITLSSETLQVMDDGRIMVAGYVVAPTAPSSSDRSNDVIVVQYLPDGTLDTSFSGDGILVADIGALLGGEVGSDDRIYAMKVTEDGKIIIAGTTNVSPSLGSEFLVMHYRADGTLNTNFDGDGLVTTDMDPFSGASGGLEYIQSLALTKDGRIIVVGYTGGPSYARFVVVRYLADGALDASFSSDGVIVEDLSGFAINYKAAKDSVAKQVAVLDNGRIVVAGYIGFPDRGESIAIRYRGDGSVDTTFGSDGVVITIIDTEDADNNSYVKSMRMMEDGRMILAGSLYLDTERKVVVTRHVGDASPQYDIHLVLPILHR